MFFNTQGVYGPDLTFSQAQKLEMYLKEGIIQEQDVSSRTTQCHTNMFPLVAHRHSCWTAGLELQSNLKSWERQRIEMHLPPPQHFIVCNDANYIFCKDKCRCAKKGTKPQHLWNRWSQYILEQLSEQMDDPALLPTPDCIFGTPV